MNISIRFAHKYNTSPGVYYEMVFWREKKLSIKDIRVLLIRRKVNITYISTWRWVKKADKTLKNSYQGWKNKTPQLK